MNNNRKLKGVKSQIKFIEKSFGKTFKFYEIDKIHFGKCLIKDVSIRDFIDENPIILSKKIMLPDKICVTDYDKVVELMDKYSDISDKVYVLFEDDLKYIKLKECFDTIKIIKDKAEEIKKLDMSPMENIMYVYDFVRDRVYNKEEKGSDPYDSRALSKVLFGDKIVCIGYSKIFNALLNCLGERSEEITVRIPMEDGSKSFHSRNMVYVKDSKYDIDGVYFFDSTWDSKEKEGNNSYLSKYSFFAKTLQCIENYVPFEFDCSFSEMNLYSKDLYDKVKFEYDFNNGDAKKYSSVVSKMCSFLGVEAPLIISHPFIDWIDMDEFFANFKEVCEKFNKEIPGETMLKLLNNVRKIEYYQNSDWYPYTIEDLYEVFVKSDWKFENEHLSQDDKEMRFLNIIMGVENEPLSLEDIFWNYSMEENICQDINGVRFTKVLQKTLEKKN